MLRYITFLSLFISFSAFTQTLDKKEIPEEQKQEIAEHMAIANDSSNADDYRTRTFSLNIIAYNYWANNHFDSAAKYYEYSLELNKKLDNDAAITKICNNLGLIYVDMGMDSIALAYFSKSFQLRQENQDRAGSVSAIMNIAVILNKLDQSDSALSLLEKGLSYALEAKNSDDLKNIYGLMAETYQKMDNQEKMIEYYNFYRDLTENAVRESEKTKRETELKLQIAEQERRIKELELQETNMKLVEAGEKSKSLIDSLSRKELSYLVLQAEKSKLEAQTLLKAEQHERAILEKETSIQKHRNQNLLTSLFLVVLGLLLSFSIYTAVRRKKNNKILQERNAIITKSNEKIQNQKVELEQAFDEIAEKNYNITSSINYAERIQKSLFMNESDLRSIFPESFIFFRPLSIVSGDFYWFRKIDKTVIIACADCTGHGIPGALTSIIGYVLLNQIIYAEQNTQPELVLGSLRKQFHKTLSQNDKNSQLRDGMEITLCSIDTEHDNVQVAASKHAFAYIDNEQNLHRVRGDKIVIGTGVSKNANENETDYTRYEFTSAEIQNLYMFSDGIIDQFSSESGRRFGTKRLMQTFTEAKKMSINEQKNFISEKLDVWKGEAKQTDDMLIVGFNFL